MLPHFKWCRFAAVTVTLTTLSFLLLPVACQAQSNVAAETSGSESSTQPTSGTESIMKVSQVEGISEYRLENGVRVLLFPDPSKDVVTVNMTIFVGSRHEGYGEAGMAHLLEHMLFKGTPKHPDIPQVLDERGARFNGTTGVDRTNYYETMPATDENLRFALELESDRLVNSFIRGEDLESEMTVVRNEFERGENSPFGVLMQRMRATAYEWHNYGQSTIGNRSDIERVPVVSLRRFYRKYYRCDNVMVIVAGKFESDHALQQIQETFGQLTAPDTPIDPTYTVEPPQDGERTVVLRRVGDVQLVGATYHIPAASHPDFAAAKVLTYALGDEPSGRLYRQMVETELASNVYAFAFSNAEPGVLMAMAEVPPENSLEQARVKLIDVIEQSFRETPVTEKEVERAVQQLLKRREIEAAEPDRLAVSLSEWAAQGDWRLYFLFRDRLEKLTPEDVQKVADEYLVRNNRTVGLFIPTNEGQRVSIPDAPNLAEIFKDYKGREVVQAGETLDPDPLAIEKRTLRGNLVGGVKYAMLPKKTRGGVVTLNSTLRFGSAESLHGRVGAVELLGLMMARGTEKLDYQALQDELTRLRVEFSMHSTSGVLQSSIKTKREFLPEVVALFGDVLRRPRMDADELEVIRRQIVAQLQQGQSEPQALAPRWVNRELSPYKKGDIRYVPTIDEEIEMYRAVSIDEIRDLHQRFLSNQQGELSVVGDFDPDELKQLLADALKDWETDQPYVRADRPANTDVPGTLKSIETPDKANAFYYSKEEIALSDEDEDYAPLVLGNYILGGGSLTSRLGDRVRQQEGLSYTVRSSVSTRPQDDRVDFLAYAITNPQNIDQLIEVINEEIDKIRDEGITQEELQQAKSGYLQAARVRRTNDGALAGELLSTIFNDRTLEFRKRLEQRIADATVESVNAAIRKYLQPTRLVRAAAGDFAAVKAEK